jgi:hypothetical protein
MGWWRVCLSVCGHYGKQMAGTRIIDAYRSIVFAIKRISHGDKSSLSNLHKCTAGSVMCLIVGDKLCKVPL